MPAKDATAAKRRPNTSIQAATARTTKDLYSKMRGLRRAERQSEQRNRKKSAQSAAIPLLRRFTLVALQQSQRRLMLG